MIRSVYGVYGIELAIGDNWFSARDLLREPRVKVAAGCASYASTLRSLPILSLPTIRIGITAGPEIHERGNPERAKDEREQKHPRVPESDGTLRLCTHQK